MSLKGKRCFVYTRVSSLQQVDGFSLDGQLESVSSFASAYDMKIVEVFSDEGFSGKNISGRPEFSRMLRTIRSNPDVVDYILVYKLSRFGRSAADTLGTLKELKNYDVYLYSVEEHIDSASHLGELLVAILASLSEMERENIRTFTSLGHSKGFESGRWQGGAPPAGYYLKDKELFVDDSYRDIIELIFKLYGEEGYSVAGVVKYLLSRGIKRPPHKNSKLDYFSTSSIKRILDNPVYKGYLAYGRRRVVPKKDKKDETHVVRQKDFPVVKGIHEAIVSEELWDLCHSRRVSSGVKFEKKYNLERVCLLSGLVKCPVCGATLYSNISRKRKPSGGIYKDYFYFACKHRLLVEGAKCTFKNQIHQDRLTSAVYDIVKGIISDDLFVSGIQKQLSCSVDTSVIESDISSLEQHLGTLERSIRSLSSEIDSLDADSSSYSRIYQDMTTRLYRLYDDLSFTEGELSTARSKLLSVRKERLSYEGIKSLLSSFDLIWSRCSDLEKQSLFRLLIERIEIYPERLSSGRLIKSITFKFPLSNGEKLLDLSLDSCVTDECCVLLSKLYSEGTFSIYLSLDSSDATCGEYHASYSDIKSWVLDTYGVKVSSLYISQVKRSFGLNMGTNYNVSKKGTSVPICPPEKFDMISSALRHFKIIS